MTASRESINTCRRVANLSAAQLESKRAIDRANQRHLRAKRKSQAAQLQAHVEALTRELEGARGQLESTREELDVCRETLRNAPAAPPSGEAALPPGDGWLGDDMFRQLFPVDMGDMGDAGDAGDPPHGSGAEQDRPWQQTPLHVAPEHPLDHVIVGTVSALRQARPSSAAEEHAPGAGRFPSIASLLHRGAGSPIAEAAASQVGRSSVRSFTARIGFLWLLAHLLRWYVCRSPETYDALPVFLRPTVLQRTVAHPPWVDVIVWPAARDAIIQHMNWSCFPTFRRLTGASLSVNWPSGAPLLETADGRAFTLKADFEAHVRDTGNWTLGGDVGDAFSFMRPFCRA